jgi:hypothetical protein
MPKEASPISRNAPGLEPFKTGGYGSFELLKHNLEERGLKDLEKELKDFQHAFSRRLHDYIAILRRDGMDGVRITLARVTDIYIFPRVAGIREAFINTAINELIHSVDGQGAQVTHNRNAVLTIIKSGR